MGSEFISSSLAPDASSPQAPVLACRNLSVRFGGKVALDDCSISFASNQIHGLIGPNGAGKTTLLNVLSGFQRPQIGEVLMGGEDVTGWTVYRLHRIGIVRTFQSPRIFPDLTVLENVLVADSHFSAGGLHDALWRRRRTRRLDEELAHRSIELLRQFDLLGVANNRGDEISGGQQRLLEMARVLHQRPRVLLLDEPTAGVNPTLRKRLIEHIRGLHSKWELPIVLVEHNMRVVEELSQVVHVMAQGRLLVSGNMSQLRENRDVVDAYLGHNVMAERK